MSKNAKTDEQRELLIGGLIGLTEPARETGRNLTENEKLAFNRIEKRVRQLDGDSDMTDEVKSAGETPPTTELDDPVSTSTAKVLDPATRRRVPIQTASRTSPDRWVDADGKDVVVLSRTDKYADRFPEVEPLSLGRAIVGMVTSNWRHAEAEKFTMSEVVGSAGGVMVPDQLLAGVIDKARARSVLVRGGAATVVMTTDRTTIARITDDATIATKSENAAFTASDVSFDSIGFTAHTIGALCKMSRELAADAPNSAQVIEDSIASALAAKIDWYGLRGSGSAMPLGLINMTISNAITGIGGITYDDLLDAIEAIETDNHTPTGYTLNPRNITVLRKLLVNAEANHYVTPPPAVAALTALTTSALANTDGAMGDFSKFLIGLRQNALVEISTEADTAFAAHQLWIKITWRGDFNVSDPNAFCLLQGIT